MATQVVMPKLSPTMEEGQVARWLKKEGDKVSMGEPIAEIDTDKATMEMQALSAGVLRKVLVQEGESAPLGQPIAIIGEPDEDIADLLKGGQTADPPKEAVAQPKEAAEPSKVESDDAPAVEQKEAAPQPEIAREVQTDGKRPAGGRMLVSPIAARMAAESGVDLNSIKGSGPSGRIIKRDIEEAMKAPKAASSGAPQLRPMAMPKGQPGAIYGPSAYRDEPMSEMRRTIAKRLVTSLGPIPHFFLTTEIEMDRAADMRQQINTLYTDANVSLNDVIIKVAAVALIQHPQVNASFQDKTVRHYEHADIGVAVATDNGLITPIVRAADVKSLLDIATEVRELAGRARTRKLKPEEYMGATFSISNLGMFGIDEFTAVINPPEAAILAVGAMKPKPVARGDQVEIHQMMRVTMSCDHRVVDGAVGAQFLQTFKQILENPLYLFLGS
ncbi:MAG: pyruvate dehydrogenase complex dihydrolipoamide acetyltransferase [Acidobacteriota bacterium]